jgi:energy-coupling factor transporter ATP-binding protein EcfA2
MKLTSFKFQEVAPTRWTLKQINLEKINLVVGKNASGKTRTLNVIAALANLVSGDRALPSDSVRYFAEFDHNGSRIEYTLKYGDKKVTEESLKIDGSFYLKRGEKGEGYIKAIELGLEKMKFQAPESELACVAKRDNVQHPFFDTLFSWGESLRHYQFGSQMGKDTVTIPSSASDNEEKAVNLKSTNNVIPFLNLGISKHGDDFIKKIQKDMKRIGYSLKEIGIDKHPSITFQGTHPNGIYLKESGLPFKLFQDKTSQGMFRALSLIIHLNFAQLENDDLLIIIDDIGEGLDYERSTKLISLIIDKTSKKDNIQVIMSTNDQYVMNEVPLEYWQVISRTGSNCKIFNYNSSKEIFDDFKFAGLSNFNFFKSGFYSKGFENK